MVGLPEERMKSYNRKRKLFNRNKNLLSQRTSKETQLSTGLPLQSDLVSSRGSGRSDVRQVTPVNLFFFSQVFYSFILLSTHPFCFFFVIMLSIRSTLLAKF